MADRARITKVAIVGSCVSRDPFSAVTTDVGQVTSYIARQSFAGLTNPPIAHEAEWYADINSFERRCAITSLAKDDQLWAFESNADVLIIDYIDERFALLDIEGAYVPKTRHVMQPGFMARYEQRMTTQARLSPDTTSRWRAGAAVFFERALRTFPANRIILHEAVWAPCFKAADGGKSEFDIVYERMIEPNNRLLNEYFEITKALVPGISVLRVPDDALYADPNHRWSKEPFHYIGRYYEEFLAGLDRLVSSVVPV